MSFENHAQMNGESSDADVHVENISLESIPNDLDKDREIQGLGVWRGDVFWRWRWLELQMAHLDKQLANHKKSLDAASASVASREAVDSECSRTRGYVPSRSCRSFKSVGANGTPKQLSAADKKKHPLFGYPTSRRSAPVSAVASGAPTPNTRTRQRRKSTRGRKSLTSSRVRKTEHEEVPVSLSSSRSTLPDAPKIIHTPTWRKVDFGKAQAKYKSKVARRNLTMSAPCKMTRKTRVGTHDIKRLTVITPKGKNYNKLSIKAHTGDGFIKKEKAQTTKNKPRANPSNSSPADDDDIILLISNPKVPQDTNHKANGGQRGGYQADVNHVNNANNRLVNTQKPYTDPTNSGIQLIKAIPQPVKNNGVHKANGATTNGKQVVVKTQAAESKVGSMADLSNIQLDKPVDLEEDEEMPLVENDNGARLEDMEYTSSSSSDEETDEEFYNFMHFQKEVEEKMLFETATKDRKRLRPRDIRTTKKDYMESPLRPSYDCQPHPPRVPDGEWMASPMPKRTKRRKKTSRKSNRGRKRKSTVVPSLLPHKFPKTLRAIPVTQVSATDQVYALAASVQPSTRYKGAGRRKGQRKNNRPPKPEVVWEVLNKARPIDPKTKKKRHVIYLRCKPK